MKASLSTVIGIVNKNKRVRKAHIAYGAVCSYNFSLRKKQTYASIKVYKERVYLKSSEEILEEETKNKEEGIFKKISETTRQTIMSFETNKVNDVISYLFNEIDEWDKPINHRKFANTVPNYEESNIIILVDKEIDLLDERSGKKRQSYIRRKIKTSNYVIKE